ncbi:uncharacterized protein [Dermacentor albipictus]|uniref:uncharacterized protein n=1 Tax=Dermacentor albipictus TaxID=60249 RepID=UPI0038FD15E9
MGQADGVKTYVFELLADNFLDPGNRDCSDKLFVGTVIILLLLIAGLLFIYLSGSSAGASAHIGSGEGESSGGGDGSSGPSGPSGPSGQFIKATPPPPTTRATRRHRTIAVQTTSPTPDLIQETPHTARPVPKKREPYEDLLLCTISHRAIFKEMYPPDGHCDLLFYTTAYYEPSSKEFLGARDQFSFDVFRSQARSAGANSKTGYGVSFDYTYSSLIDDELKRTPAQHAFQALWNNNIYHYGMLHILDSLKRLTYKNQLRLIKTIKERQDALGASKNGQRVLGFLQVYKSDITTLVNFTQWNYPVTIIVTCGHTWKASYDDVIRVPQLWIGPKMTNLNDIASHWAKVKINDNVRIMVSFTMSASVWITKGSTGSATNPLSYRCKWWNPVVYVQSCKDTFSKTKYIPSAETMISSSKGLEVLLAFDTAENLRKKTELFFARVGNLPKKHGLALYDVDFDDYTNACGKGAFQRLKTLSRYLHL